MPTTSQSEIEKAVEEIARTIHGKICFCDIDHWPVCLASMTLIKDLILTSDLLQGLVKDKERLDWLEHTARPIDNRINTMVLEARIKWNESKNQTLRTAIDSATQTSASERKGEV